MLYNNGTVVALTLKRMKVALVRKLQGLKEEIQRRLESDWKDLLKQGSGIDPNKCPKCRNGILDVAKTFLPLLSTA